MRILVHEFVSGGGLAGRVVPRTLATEGAAMRFAIAKDLTALGHRVIVTVDPRFPQSQARGLEVVTLNGVGGGSFRRLLASVDAAWIIAPETGGCLERLAARIERAGVRLVGSGSAAIRRSSDKRALSAVLARSGVPHPYTLVVRRSARAVRAATRLGYPVVVKPARGAGGEGVSLVRGERELAPAVSAARLAGGPVLLQQFVPGVAASVSLVSDGRAAIALAVNGQRLRLGRRALYAGGRTPLDHPMASLAAASALQAVRAFPGLKGFVGVDVVITPATAVVIEVNPRVTTAYLGVRACLDANVAGLVLEAAHGRPIRRPRTLPHAVDFTASGKVRRVARRGTAP